MFISITGLWIYVILAFEPKFHERSWHEKLSLSYCEIKFQQIPAFQLVDFEGQLRLTNAVFEWLSARERI